MRKSLVESNGSVRYWSLSHTEHAAQVEVKEEEEEEKGTHV